MQGYCSESGLRFQGTRGRGRGINECAAGWCIVRRRRFEAGVECRRQERTGGAIFTILYQLFSSTIVLVWSVVGIPETQEEPQSHTFDLPHVHKSREVPTDI